MTANSKNEIHVTALVKNSSFKLKVDSGAKSNVISDTTITSLSLSSKPLLNTNNGVKLVTYSKDTIPTLGTCVLHCKISDVLCQLEFQVVKGNAKTILGLKDALKLNFISLHPDVHEIKPDNIPSDIWSDYRVVQRPARMSFDNLQDEARPGCSPCCKTSAKQSACDARKSQRIA